MLMHYYVRVNKRLMYKNVINYINFIYLFFNMVYRGLLFHMST